MNKWIHYFIFAAEAGWKVDDKRQQNDRTESAEGRDTHLQIEP